MHVLPHVSLDYNVFRWNDETPYRSHCAHFIFNVREIISLLAQRFLVERSQILLILGKLRYPLSSKFSLLIK